MGGNGVGQGRSCSLGAGDLAGDALVPAADHASALGVGGGVSARRARGPLAGRKRLTMCRGAATSSAVPNTPSRPAPRTTTDSISWPFSVHRTYSTRMGVPHSSSSPGLSTRACQPSGVRSLWSLSATSRQWERARSRWLSRRPAVPQPCGSARAATMMGTARAQTASEPRFAGERIFFFWERGDGGCARASRLIDFRRPASLKSTSRLAQNGALGDGVGQRGGRPVVDVRERLGAAAGPLIGLSYLPATLFHIWRLH
jgi:hypothetical protein